MKSHLVLRSTIAVFVTVVATAGPASCYDDKSLEDNLLRLSKQTPNLVRAQSIACSAGRRKVWLIEVGAGSQEDRGTRPAMLVVAGIEGNDLVGTSIAVSCVQRLVEQYQADSRITELVDSTMIYLVPRVNPDAAQNFFVTPKFETGLSTRPVKTASSSTCYLRS
jgi:murein tripeptide amidase MpaA